MTSIYFNGLLSQKLSVLPHADGQVLKLLQIIRLCVCVGERMEECISYDSGPVGLHWLDGSLSQLFFSGGT